MIATRRQDSWYVQNMDMMTLLKEICKKMSPQEKVIW